MPWKPPEDAVAVMEPTNNSWQPPSDAVPVEDNPPSLGSEPEQGWMSSIGHGAARLARDTGVTALKGLAGLPQAVTGIADMLSPADAVPGGRLLASGLEKAGVPMYGWSGKMQENLGVDYKKAQEKLHTLYSPETQQAYQNVQQAKGILGKAAAAIQNPSVIATTVGESLPVMAAGGLIGRAASSIPTIGKYGYAIGEGLMAAGSGAEQARAQSPTGLLTQGQVATHMASGALTGALGVVGAKIARRLGINDVDVLLSGGAPNKADKNVIYRAVAGALVEGGAEEFPQSAQEKMAQNISEGKPWLEGVDEAAVLGLLSGAVMGGGTQLRPRAGRTQEQTDLIRKIREENRQPSRSEAKLLGISGQSAAERAKALDELEQEEQRRVEREELIAKAMEEQRATDTEVRSGAVAPGGVVPGAGGGTAAPVVEPTVADTSEAGQPKVAPPASPVAAENERQPAGPAGVADADREMMADWVRANPSPPASNGLDATIEWDSQYLSELAKRRVAAGKSAVEPPADQLTEEEYDEYASKLEEEETPAETPEPVGPAEQAPPVAQPIATQVEWDDAYDGAIASGNDERAEQLRKDYPDYAKESSLLKPQVEKNKGTRTPTAAPQTPPAAAPAPETPAATATQPAKAPEATEGKEYSGTPTVDQEGMAANGFRIRWPGGAEEVVYGQQNVQPTIEARKKGPPVTSAQIFAEAEAEVKAERKAKADNVAKLVDAHEKLKRQNPNGSDRVKMPDLRREAGLPEEDFNAAALKAGEDGLLTLFPEDDARELTPELKAAEVPNSVGVGLHIVRDGRRPRKPATDPQTPQDATVPVEVPEAAAVEETQQAAAEKPRKRMGVRETPEAVAEPKPKQPQRLTDQQARFIDSAAIGDPTRVVDRIKQTASELGEEPSPEAIAYAEFVVKKLAGKTSRYIDPKWLDQFRKKYTPSTAAPKIGRKAPPTTPAPSEAPAVAEEQDDLRRKLRSVSNKRDRRGYEPISDAEFAQLVDAGYVHGKGKKKGALTDDGYRTLQNLDREIGKREHEEAARWDNEQDIVVKKIMAGEPVSREELDKYSLTGTDWEKRAKVAAVSEAPKQEAKEPWQMTVEAWSQWEAAAFGDEPRPVSPRQREWHKGHVRDALASGKPVPAEVLADYPDLQPVSQPTEKPKEKIAGRNPVSQPTQPAKEIPRATQVRSNQGQASQAGSSTQVRQGEGGENLRRNVEEPISGGEVASGGQAEGGEEAVTPATEKPRLPQLTEDDRIDVSGLSDQELRHLKKRNPRQQYTKEDHLGNSVDEEFSRREIKDYTEGPEEAKPLLEKYQNTRRLREENEQAVTSAHTAKNMLEQRLIQEEASKRGVPLGGRGEHGLSSAKKYSSAVANAKVAAADRSEMRAAEQKILDAKSEVLKAKEAEKEAERVWNKAAAEGMPKIPAGQKRIQLSETGTGRGRSITVLEFDTERGEYKVEGAGSYETYVSPQPLLDNYVSEEEFARIKEIEDAFRTAKVAKGNREYQRKASEKAAEGKVRLKNARQKAVERGKENRFWTNLKSEAKDVKGKKGKFTIQIGTEEKPESKEVSGEIMPDGVLGLSEVSEWSESDKKQKKTVRVTHIPTGMSIEFPTTMPNGRQFIALMNKAGIDWTKLPKDANKFRQATGEIKETLGKIKSLRSAWSDENLSALQDDIRTSLLETAKAAETTVKADMVLTGDDLGVTTGDKGGLKTTGADTVKNMVKVVPEFSYDPVFVVNKDKKLVYRDGFKYMLEPEQFNLSPGELTEGQTIGINLEDLGIARKTEQDVVASMMQDQGMKVTKGKDGLITVSYRGVKATLAPDKADQTKWTATGHKQAAERATQALERIRWTQPGQDEPGKGMKGPSIGQVTDKKLEFDSAAPAEAEKAKKPRGKKGATKETPTAEAHKKPRGSKGKKGATEQDRKELDNLGEKVKDAWDDLKTMGAVYDPVEQTEKQVRLIKAVAAFVQKAMKIGIKEFDAFRAEVAKKITEAGARKINAILEQEWYKVNPRPTAKQPVEETAVEAEVVETPSTEKTVEPPPPPGISPEGDTTGTKHAKTDELRAKLGLPERVKLTRGSQEELDAEAAKMMEDDPTLASRLAAEVYANPRAWEDPVLEHVMGRYIRDLENRRQDGEDVLDEMAIAVEANAKAGSLEGAVFRARQEVRAPDFSLPGIIRQYSETVKKQPSREEQAKYAELADRIKVLESEKNELHKKLAEEEVKRRIAEAAAKQNESTPPKTGTKKQALTKKVSDAIATFKQEWSTLFEMGAVSDPKRDADKWIRITKAAGQVIKAYAELKLNSFVELMSVVSKDMGTLTPDQVEAFREAWDTHQQEQKAESPLGEDPEKAAIGARAKELMAAAIDMGLGATKETWEEVVDAVHEQLSIEVPGISRYDTMQAMSDYGQWRPLPEEDKAVKIRAIRGKVRQSLKIEDLLNAIAQSEKWLADGVAPEEVAKRLQELELLPKATGREQATPDSIERVLIAQVNKLKKDLPVSVESREGQLKSALSTAKTAGRNRLELLDKEIEALEEAVTKRTALARPVDERTPLKPDDELAKIRKKLEERRKKRDELKTEYEKIFPPTKKQRMLTAEQQTQRALKEIDRLQEQLKQVNAGKKTARTKQPSLAPAEIQAQLKMWRDRLKAAKQAAKDAELARWEGEGGQVLPPIGRKPLTDAQRLKMAEQMIQRQIDAVKAETKALERGAWQLKDKTISLTSPTKEKLQQELKALKQIRNQARKASPAYQAQEEAKYWERYRKSQEKRLAFWEQRLDDATQGKLPEKKKKRTPTENAIIDKNLEIDAVKQRTLAEIERAKRANYNAGQWIGAGIHELTSLLPRTLMAGAELSVFGRQGVFVFPSHPVISFFNAVQSMQAVFSARIAFAATEDIQQRQNAREYGQGNVEFTKESGPEKTLEEMYQSEIVRWLEETEGKIWLPLRAYAKMYMAFERGFRTFRNTMAADLYDILKRDTVNIREFFDSHGIKTRPWGETDIKEIGRSANVFSGRGTGLRSGSKALDWLLFARRWVWSRIQAEFIIPFQMASPKFIGQWNADPAMRIAHAKLYVQSLAGLATYMAVRHWLYLLFSDDDDDRPTVEFDPRSSDLWKEKIGETRIDSLGGMQQPIVLAARILTGKTKTAGGKIRSIYGDDVKWGESDAADAIIQFVRGKLGPAPSGLLDWFAGRNLVGERKTTADLVRERMTPMAHREMWEAEKELGLKRGAAAALEGFIGMSVSTYGPRTEYRAASEAERKELFEKDLENMQWDDPPEPAYSEFLTESQIAKYKQRHKKAQANVVYNAAAPKPTQKINEPYGKFKERKAEYEKEHERAIEKFNAMAPKFAPTIGEAKKLLIKYYNAEGGITDENGKIKPSYDEREARLSALYRGMKAATK